MVLSLSWVPRLLTAASALKQQGHEQPGQQQQRRQLQPWMEDGGVAGAEDYYYDDDDFVMQYLGKYQSQIEQCGMDLSPYLADADDGGAMGDDGAFDPTAMMASMKLSAPCSPQRKEDLRQALLEFETCSGYEMIELNEAFFSSVFGVAIKCVNSMTALDMATLDVPEDCAKALLGHHPLGNMFRDVLLHPGQLTKCSDQLGHAVPQCSVDLWPFPIDGKFIRQNTCLISVMESIWTDVCADGLKTLAECLPSGPVTPGQCSQIKQKCSSLGDPLPMALMMMPKTLAGVPLPDACRAQNTRAADLYDAYRTTCAARGKALWDGLEAKPTEEEDAYTTIHEFLFPNIHKDDIAAVTEPALAPAMEQQQEEQEQMLAAAQEVAPSKKKKGSSGFGFGMISGVIVAAVAYVGVGLFMKHRNGGKVTLASGFELLSGADLFGAGASAIYSDDNNNVDVGGTGDYQPGGGVVA